MSVSTKATPAVSHEVLHALVKDARKRFDLSHGGYKLNHLTHALISLYRLGASEETMKDMIDYSAKKYNLKELKPSQNRITLANWTSHFGDRSYYPDYIDFFRLQRKDNPTKVSAINSFFPRLMVGMGGGALHGPIELGWGLLANVEVEEGLAFCASLYLEIGSTAHEEIKAEPTKSILEIFAQVHQENATQKLFKFGVKKGEIDSTLGSLVSAKVGLDGQTNVENYGLKKVKTWKLDNSRDGLYAAFGELTQAALLLLYSADCKYFFVLHVLTCTFACKQIARSLNDLATIESMLISLTNLSIYIYILQGAHPIKSIPEQSPPGADWERICSLAMQRKDQHVIKVVDVCRSVVEEYPALDLEALALSVAWTILENVSDSGGFIR